MFAMALGAALAWLFDPQNGPRRRADVKRKLEQKGVLGNSDTSSDFGDVPTAVSAIR